MITDDPAQHVETKLWRAVVASAIRDALGDCAAVSTPEARELAMGEARRWFKFGGADFQEVCELAELDPETVRSNVLRMIANGETPASLSELDPTRRKRGRPRGTGAAASRDVTAYNRTYSQERRARLIAELGIEEVRRRGREAAKKHQLKKELAVPIRSGSY